MNTKTPPVAAFVLLVAVVLGELDRARKAPAPPQTTPSASSAFPPSRALGVHPSGGRSIPVADFTHTANGLAWLSPDDPWARALGRHASRQLRGRYWIGSKGHLYLKISNREEVGLLRRRYPERPPQEPWWVLCEVAHFSGAKVFPRWFDFSSADRPRGLLWKGDFLLLRWSHPAAEPIACRFFSPASTEWSAWEENAPWVAASAAVVHNRWTLQWSAGLPRRGKQLSNPLPSDASFTKLYSRPFFLLPIGAGDLPPESARAVCRP